jgi:DNA invertase Pin-like site-specific DNA recombinase
VDFIAVDMPHADKFTVGIMALVAQKEREMISARTKAALAAAKARGTKLGGIRPGALSNPREAAARGLRARQERAAAFADTLGPSIESIRARGIISASGIARELNSAGIRSPRGRQWQATSVQRLLGR